MSASLVEDLDELHARMRDRGAAFVSAVETSTAGPIKGGKVVYMIDPDGIRVELVELPKGGGDGSRCMSSRDRVCVVTGGGRGIGAAISKALVDQGARVAILEGDPDLARQRSSVASKTQVRTSAPTRRTWPTRTRLSAQQNACGRISVRSMLS